jgi:hypothetical protein
MIEFRLSSYIQNVLVAFDPINDRLKIFDVASVILPCSEKELVSFKGALRNVAVCCIVLMRNTK